MASITIADERRAAKTRLEAVPAARDQGMGPIGPTPPVEKESHARGSGVDEHELELTPSANVNLDRLTAAQLAGHACLYCNRRSRTGYRVVMHASGKLLAEHGDREVCHHALRERWQLHRELRAISATLDRLTAPQPAPDPSVDTWAGAVRLFPARGAA